MIFVKSANYGFKSYTYSTIAIYWRLLPPIYGALPKYKVYDCNGGGIMWGYGIYLGESTFPFFFDFLLIGPIPAKSTSIYGICIDYRDGICCYID
jgi:hypothetical protein